METFDLPVRGLRATGASAGERDIVEWITRHAKEESALLERYGSLAQGSTSPSTRYLVDLIIEDERRHHRVLGEIAHAIAWGTISAADPAVPRMNSGSGDRAMVELAKELLASERKDRAQLRRLRRRLRSYNGTIWSLLIDLMVLDTDKHARILRHVVRNRQG